MEVGCFAAVVVAAEDEMDVAVAVVVLLPAVASFAIERAAFDVLANVVETNDWTLDSALAVILHFSSAVLESVAAFAIPTVPSWPGAVSTILPGATS